MSGTGNQPSPDRGSLKPQPNRSAKGGGEDTSKLWSTKSGVKVSAPPPKKGLHVRLGLQCSALAPTSSEREASRSLASLPKLGFKASRTTSPWGQKVAKPSSTSPRTTFINASTIVRKPRSQVERRPRTFPDAGKPDAPDCHNDFLYILAQAGESLEREDRESHREDVKSEPLPEKSVVRASGAAVPRKPRSPSERKPPADLHCSPARKKLKKASRTMVRPTVTTEAEKPRGTSSTSGDEQEDMPLLSLRKATTWKPQVPPAPVRVNLKEHTVPDAPKDHFQSMQREDAILHNSEAPAVRPAATAHADSPPQDDPVPAARLMTPPRRPVLEEDPERVYKPKVAIKQRHDVVIEEAERAADFPLAGFHVPQPRPRAPLPGPSASELEGDHQDERPLSSGGLLSDADGSAADYSDDDMPRDEEAEANFGTPELRRKRFAESQDDELTDDMDVKRQRRIEANREAARQTIRRKRAYYDGMVAQEQELQEEQEHLSASIKAARQDIEHLSDKINYLRHALNKGPGESDQGEPWHLKMARDEARRQYAADKSEQQQKQAADKRRAAEESRRADDRQRTPERGQRTEQQKHPHPHRQEAQDRPPPGFRRDQSPRSPGGPPEHSNPPPGWGFHPSGMPSWMKGGLPPPMPPGMMPPGMEFAAMAAANGGMPPGFPPMLSQGFPGGFPPGMPPPGMLSPEQMQMIAQGGPPPGPPWSLFGGMPPGLAAHLAAGGGPPMPGHPAESGMPPDIRDAQAFAAAMASAGNHPDGPPPGMGPGPPGMPMPPGYLMGNPMLAALGRPPQGSMMPGRPN